MHFARRPKPHASKGQPVTSDDLVAQILAAIEEAEQAAHGSGVLGWATYRHADGGMGYTSPVSCGEGVYVTAGEETHPDSVRVVFDEKAVLRRCAADRRRLERHTPIPNHGRFSDDWANGCPNPGDCDCGDRPKVCGACRDQAGDPLEAPCPDLLDLADSCGVAAVAAGGSAGHRVDLSGVDLSGSIDQGALDRVAEHATHRDAELKIEVHFNSSDGQGT